MMVHTSCLRHAITAVGSWLVIFGLFAAGTPSARADDGVYGVWQGRYICAQGETAVTLTIRPGKGDGGLSGLFHFYPSPGNPPVPEGCFTMAGTYDGNVRQMSLFAGRWLLRPYGFLPVDLTGQLDKSGDRMTGEVLGPACTRFEVRRISNPRPMANPACRASTPVASLQ